MSQNLLQDREFITGEVTLIVNDKMWEEVDRTESTTTRKTIAKIVTFNMGLHFITPQHLRWVAEDMRWSLGDPEAGGTHFAYTIGKRIDREHVELFCRSTYDI